MALERLLADARSGRLTGAIFAAKYSTWARGVWVVGEYVSSTEDAREASAMLRETLEDGLPTAANSHHHQPAMLYQMIAYPDGTAKMPFCTPAVERLFRTTVEQVRVNSRVIDAVIHPDDLARLVEYSKPFFKNGGMWDHEYRTRFPDGTGQTLVSRAFVRPLEDGSTLFEGVIVEK